MKKKSKLLICSLIMSIVLTGLPSMVSNAEDATGELQEAGLQDENSQRTEVSTAMDVNGNIYEVADENGIVEVAEEPEDGMSFFSVPTVQMKVVNFNTKGNATTNFVTNRGGGYTNGAYGADAAFLGYESNNRVKFMLSGVVGIVNESEVQVLPYNQVANNLSYYTVSGGKLVHYITQNIRNGLQSPINNGIAPTYLAEGGKYYSYDGHYFYAAYEQMLIDYQNGQNGQNALNAGNPFYNKFQFKNMREVSSYNATELENVLNIAFANNGKNIVNSKLNGTAESFVQYQNEFQVNALLSLGVAINESAWGHSWIAQNKNNLFGLNAIDSAPGTNASVFESPDACIRDFMKNWMSNGYLSASDWRNKGECLGNKNEGINFHYASDPYWGEKAASIVWNLDAVGGNKEYNGGMPMPEEKPEVEEPAPQPEEEKPEVKPEEKPEVKPEEKPEVKPEEKPEVKPEEKPEVKPEEKPEVKPEEKPEVKPEEKPEVKPEEKPEVKPEEKPEVKPEEKPEVKPEEKPEVKPEEKPEVKPEEKPEVKPEEKPEVKPEEKPNVEIVIPQKPMERPSVNVNPSKKIEATVENKTFEITGSLSENATLEVSAFDVNSIEYQKYIAASELAGKNILGVYDIKVTGMTGNLVNLAIYVGAEYEGKTVIALHYTEDGTYETFSGVVRNGKVNFDVKGFSPYVLALENDVVSTSTVPKTGDTSNVVFWLALTLCSSTLVVFLRKKMNK